MKESELICPWGCKGSFEVCRLAFSGEYFYDVKHECNYLEAEAHTGKVFKTEQEAMKNWNSWKNG